MNPLGGMFERPEEKRTFGQKARNAFRGFGAGLAGFGPEFIAMQRQEQQQLDEQRKKAMAQDAMSVYQLLNDNKIDDAISLVDRRVKYISELGGDPSDTLEIRQMLTTPGRLDEARQELGLFVQASMENGLLPVPERREPIRVGANDRLVDPNTFEEIVSAAPAAQEQEPAAVQSLRIRAAEAGLQPGTQPYVDFMLSGGGGGGGVSVPITVQAAGGASDELNKAVDQQLAGYMQAAATSAAAAPQLEMLSQLAPLTTQGQVPAALSRMFPTMNDANTAFIGITNQILPSLRVPGSGAQSDKDVDVLLNSIGSLASSPETKQMLIQSLMMKNQINQRLADITQEVVEGVTTRPEATRRIREIQSRSIISPELQAILGGLGDAPPIPQAYVDIIEPEIWQSMTTAQRAAFQ